MSNSVSYSFTMEWSAKSLFTAIWYQLYVGTECKRTENDENII
jgi:hypothetical protein